MFSAPDMKWTVCKNIAVDGLWLPGPAYISFTKNIIIGSSLNKDRTVWQLDIFLASIRDCPSIADNLGSYAVSPMCERVYSPAREKGIQIDLLIAKTNRSLICIWHSSGLFRRQPPLIFHFYKSIRGIGDRKLRSIWTSVLKIYHTLFSLNLWKRIRMI